MKFILIVTTLLMSHLAGAQTMPDFNHRNVTKEINKVFGTDQFTVTTNNISENKDFVFLKSNNQPLGYAYLKRVYSCRSGSCALPNNGSSEYFDYLLIFDQQGVVKTAKIINYAATHGQQIASPGWLRQFAGFKGDEEKKVGKNVDAIAGATISANAITEDINKATKALKDGLNR
jgi:Na+-translocating ferredoxin:NAD+ oxidoreductase RnfG subunit